MAEGLAQGVKVTEALDRVGIFASAWVWRWRPGNKGGTFPEHAALDGQYENDILNFGSLPGGDVNGDWCNCDLQTIFRDERGRFAPAPAR